jgi:hypothetical protein
MCDSDRSEIANSILSYLVENTAAQDTFEGIVEWWLLEQRIKHDSAAIRDVLADLTAKDLVLTYESGDRRIHYRVNHGKEEEIRTLLESKGN